MSAQTFDFGKAVFHIFQVAGRRPAAVLWIALWQALLTAGLLYLAFATVGDFYIWIVSEAMSGQEPREAEILTRMAGVMSAMPLVSVGGMLIALMAQAAWLRLLTRDEMAPVIPFRLGGDELRLFVTNLGLLALGIAFYLVAVAVTLILVGGLIAAMAGEGSAEAGLAGGFAVSMLFLLFAIAAIFVGIRVSAAPATTIFEKRIAFPAWGATRGIFWPVLGAYVLVAIIIGVLSAVVGTILNLTLLGAFLPVIGELIALAQNNPQPAPEEAIGILRDALSEPGILASFVAVGLLSVILRSFSDAIWHSVGASVAVQRGTQPVDE
jgi:hypothetical protein